MSGETDMEFEARVYGKVQGIGFRAYAKKRADELGLSGVARNLEDGSLEVVAQGERAKLEELARLLKNGPVFSRVDEFEIDWHESASDPLAGFVIE